ncbi:MAG TPA: hypothetical protein VFD94_09905, partial [Jatrophihabitans sp.]|nr:hypothetical protein [Jatrophihabitans sp.]
MISLCKSAVVGLTVAGLGAGLLTAAAPALAAPAPSPAYTARLGLPGATALAVANKHLFVSLHDSVYVRDLTGAAVKTINTIEPNLSTLLASPDGNTVYAADSKNGAIVVIDTTTLTVKANWAAGGCVTSMAIASGRLFFSHGCSSPYAIASLDQATGGSAVASGTTDTFYQAPVLAAANGHLVAAEGTVYSYTAASDGTLTELAKSSFGVDRQLAISPDGSQVAAAEMAPYQVVQFDTATMTEDETYPTGAYPNAVAFNGAGNRLAAGLTPSGNSSVQLYDTGTGTELSSIGPADTMGYTRQGIAGTVSFGPDLTGKPDALVYSLAEDYSNGAYLQVASVAPLTIAHLTLALSSPKAWGQPLLASVNFPGHPNTALTLKVLPNSGSPIYVPVRTNQWGTLTANVGVNFT